MDKFKIALFPSISKRVRLAIDHVDSERPSIRVICNLPAGQHNVSIQYTKYAEVRETKTQKLIVQKIGMSSLQVFTRDT